MNDRKRPLTLLFNPFVYIAGGIAFVLGVAAMLLAAWIGSFRNGHFDGVLDFHLGSPAPLWVLFSEVTIDWLSLSIVLFIFGLVLSKSSFRLIDLLGTEALARWPTIFLSLVVLPNGFQRFTKKVLEQLQQGNVEFKTWDAAIFLAVTAGIVVFTVWMVVLMYKAFSVSCNVKGGKAIGVFIVCLIVAEVISKLALYFLFQTAGLMEAAPVST